MALAWMKQDAEPAVDPLIALLADDEPDVVRVASKALGQIGQAAYSASKGGIAALTLPAAREFAQFGIRVLTIAPGVMDTPMVGGMTDEVRDSLAATVRNFHKRFPQ